MGAMDLKTPLITHLDDETKKEKKWTRFFTGENLITLLWLLAVIFFGSVNNVAKKVMAETMAAKYQYFISNFTAVGYVFFYGIILSIKACTGSVTKEMLYYAKWPLIISGLMDGLGNILGTLSTRHLDGAILPLLAQCILPFSMICSLIILKQRFSFAQIVGAAIVLCGAIVSLIPQFSNFKSSASLAFIFFAFMQAISTLPNAVSFSVKELYFKSFKEKVDSRGLDVFIVSFFGSFFQFLWTIAFYPIIAIPGFGGVPFRDLSDVFVNGMKCFVGVGDECSGNPWAPLVYICLNLCFNIGLIVLLKRGGALLMFIGIKACVPFTSVLYYIKWPYLKREPPTTYVWIAMVIIMTGLVVYRFSSVVKEEKDAKKKQQELIDAANADDNGSEVSEDLKQQEE